MTERHPALHLTGDGAPGLDWRRLLGTMAEDAEGVQDAGDLQVSQRGAGANMSVDVAGGRAFTRGTERTYQGTYFAENEGVTNLTVSTADATLDRIDLVVAKVADGSVSGAENRWALAILEGTAASTPSAPALPPNALALARVAVDAAATSIVDADITDLRWRWEELGPGSYYHWMATDASLTVYRANRATAPVFTATKDPASMAWGTWGAQVPVPGRYGLSFSYVDDAARIASDGRIRVNGRDVAGGTVAPGPIYGEETLAANTYVEADLDAGAVVTFVIHKSSPVKGANTVSNLRASVRYLGPKDSTLTTGER